MKVDLVIPFFNEEKNLEILVNELNEVIPKLKNKYSIIFINDGSEDNSEKIIKEKIKNISFDVLSNNRNLGQTASFQKAFDFSSGEFMIRMDSDLQDYPKDLFKFDDILKPDVDIILGFRAKRKHNYVLKVLSLIFDKIIFYMGFSNLSASSGSFIAFRSIFLKGIKLKKNDHRYLTIIAQSQGARNNFVINISHRKRIHGKSNYNTVKKIFSGFFELLGLIRRLKKGYYQNKNFN